MNKLDLKMYEVFREEEKYLRDLMPPEIIVEFTENTIQEEKDDFPPSKFKNEFAGTLDGKIYSSCSFKIIGNIIQ